MKYVKITHKDLETLKNIEIYLYSQYMYGIKSGVFLAYQRFLNNVRKSLKVKLSKIRYHANESVMSALENSVNDADWYRPHPHMIVSRVIHLAENEYAVKKSKE